MAVFSFLRLLSGNRNMVAWLLLSGISVFADPQPEALNLDDQPLAQPAATGPLAPPEVNFGPLTEQLNRAAPEARDEILASWEKQNRPQLEARHLWYRQQAASRPAPTLSVTEEVIISADATPEMEDLLITRVGLQNSFAQAFNAVRTKSSLERAAALQDWDEQHTKEMAEHCWQAQIVNEQSAETSLLRIAPLPNIPRQASPELKKLLREQYAEYKQFMLEEQQIRDLPRAKRDAARKALFERRNLRKLSSPLVFH